MQSFGLRQETPQVIITNSHHNIRATRQVYCIMSYSS